MALLVASGLGLIALAVATPVSSYCPPIRGPAGVSVRLPPAFPQGPLPRPWIPPPPGFYFQAWNINYSSGQQYLAFRNLQYDPTPVDPDSPVTGQINDLFSFQLPGNATIYTSYGVDSHSTTYFPSVLDYVGTGILTGATSQYSMLAWGCDADGAAYYVTYSTEVALSKTPTAVDIESVSATGPDDATVAAIRRGLRRLGSEELATLEAELTRTMRDADRDGLGRVNTCDEYCMSNQNLLALLAAS